jgi:hypothetical protein
MAFDLHIERDIHESLASDDISYSGSLHLFKFIDLTLSIEQKFSDDQLIEILSSSEADVLIWGLAMTDMLMNIRYLIYNSISARCHLL